MKKTIDAYRLTDVNGGKMKPCDNPEFNEIWQKMMQQLRNVLTAAYTETENGNDLFKTELVKFEKIEKNFKNTVLVKKIRVKAEKASKTDRQT